ncbi:pilus assembly protein TadG-related protein [Citrifermentans bremense]|uniref:pilus assembly protein TadG-related protein n=1 Tax=Citrifermentans bremense TaxID=60035 RepID=UPI00040E0805|nr:pilus assembly protein TadG-related protein [Citrifermentans bremense]
MGTNSELISDEKGMVIVYVAILLMMLFGFLGLAVDGGHLFKVRGELQNAADAAALKGAWHLFTRPTDPTQLPTLQWEVARFQAQQMITENSSDNTALKDAMIEVGYWNMSSNVLQPTTLASPGPADIPAVRVVASRSDGSNGGPVNNFFMQIFKKPYSPVGSRPAVAMLGFPGIVPPGGLFPLALSKCMTDHYFSQIPMPDPPPQIKVSSPYLPGGETCYSGQWTSFKTDNNDVPTITDLMNNGNPTSLATGDEIWIEPGAKAALYSPILTDWLPEGGKDVIMAIVDTGSSDLSVKGDLPITGFATFHIDGAVGGSGKYVYGHFIEYFTSPPGTMPGGPPTNTLTPPRLVQ